MSATIWFMGLPASGKSTLAKRVENELSEKGFDVENLDGDEVRQNLHPDLGFSREERALNNRRTAFVCKLLNRNNITAVTAMITPFRDSQRRAREIVDQAGEYVLVYVKCPVDVCAERDPKDLYEKAKAGKIEKFTGVNHPFEEPLQPDIVVETEKQTVDESVDHVIERLIELDVLDDGPSKEYEMNISGSDEREIEDRLQQLGYFD